MTQTEAPERIIDTSEANAKRVQGAVLGSAAHLAGERFQGWANPIVVSCKDASEMIAALSAEIATLRAKLAAAREVKDKDLAVIIHAAAVLKEMQNSMHSSARRNAATEIKAARLGLEKTVSRLSAALKEV